MDTDKNKITELQPEISQEDAKSLWVFGYGSLCWKPGFNFHKAITGYVKGYQRRFWQGNNTHRGTENRPGRVATLVEEKQGIVHGVAYAINGDAAIPYLNNRECKMGSYVTQFTLFYPIRGEPFNVLLYIATQNNPLWLGQEEEEIIANDIVECSGVSGHNVEYVVRLANFMRDVFPGHHDPHLFSLEKEILKVVKNRSMCLEALMGDGDGCITFVEKATSSSLSTTENDHERTDSFQYAARIQEKKLLCVKI